MQETPLEKATRHAMTGVRIIARHKLLIAELRADGHDTKAAEALLERFIATQHIFEDHMRAVRKESRSVPMVPISPKPRYEPRFAKMERFARALSAGWMTRAALPNLTA